MNMMPEEDKGKDEDKGEHEDDRMSGQKQR